MHKKIKTENKKINSKYRKIKSPIEFLLATLPPKNPTRRNPIKKSAGSKKLRRAFPPINKALS